VFRQHPAGRNDLYQAWQWASEDGSRLESHLFLEPLPDRCPPGVIDEVGDILPEDELEPAAGLDGPERPVEFVQPGQMPGEPGPRVTPLIRAGLPGERLSSPGSGSARRGREADRVVGCLEGAGVGEGAEPAIDAFPGPQVHHDLARIAGKRSATDGSFEDTID